jgi:hypothetical protein
MIIEQGRYIPALGPWISTNTRILGVVISVVVASAYYFVWPGWKDPERVRHRSPWSKIILRWFHSLAWALLAAACYLRATLPAVLAGGVYLIFIVTLAYERRSAQRG